MRYKITDSNVRIEHAEETETIVTASFRVLVPRVTPTLYFLGSENSDYPMLTSLQETNPTFRIIEGNQDDRTYLKHFRIVESGEDLYIAPNTSERLDRSFWRDLCDEINVQSREESKI